MAQAIRKCMVCGRFITASFFVCRDCEALYGLRGPSSVWPEWARVMRRFHDKQRYDDRRPVYGFDDCHSLVSVMADGEFNNDAGY
jgi:hypothetical protein